MTTDRSHRASWHLLFALLFAAGAQAAPTDISTVPLETYSAPTSTDVKPNVLFVLDDSGSMDWDFMPDWACVRNVSRQNSDCDNIGQSTSSSGTEYLFRNSGYNGIYYNPAIRYKPPIAVDSSGAANTTTYPSQTGAATATGADSSTKPNWRAVRNDAYGVQSTSTSSLGPTSGSGTVPTYFYTYVAGEYCTTPALRVCNAQTAPSIQYPYPAPLRWCNSSALTTCKAGFDASYSHARAPTPVLATISIDNDSNTATSVTAVTVAGTNILSAATISTSNENDLIASIAARINAGNSGYVAYAVGDTVTIVAPYAAAIASTPPSLSITKSPSGSGITFNVGTFARQGNSAERGVPGASLLTFINPDRTSYVYPNTAAKAVARTDCAGTTCTYAEEMTNFANWWTYYHTRMQLMKTSASNAFAAIDSAADTAAGVSRFRVGYMSINNNTGSDFLNLGEFKTTQKYNWFTKLISAEPNSSTPLLPALSDAGRLYAGMLNGTTFNGTRVTDPLQYSCQQNYTILSTDGFWNQGDPYQLDGSTAVGNQDAALPRPLYDGGSAFLETRTSTLQQRSINIQPRTSTSTLQQRTVSAQTQTRAGQLQTRSATFYFNWTSWSNTPSCTWDTGGPSLRECRYNWGAWSNAASCTENFSTGTSGTWTGNGTDCQSVLTYGNWTNTTACTASATMECQYQTWSAYQNTPSCTAVPQSTGPNYVGPAVRCDTVTSYGAWTNTTSCTASASTECQYANWSSWSQVAGCTAVPQSAGPNYTGPARECRTRTTGGTSDTLADTAAYYYATDLRNPGGGTGTCTGPVIPPNTIAEDLCVNNVPSNGRDIATTQHMTTFTLGLGAQGQMVYSPTYWTDTSGDFYDIKVGTTANTSSGVCSWQTSGSCNWPTPASNSIANIDDLWHAAINGRGSYFSASDPATLASGLADTLSIISNIPRPGAAAAAATSNPNTTATDNFVFSTSYKSVEWYGELVNQTIDATGNLQPQLWSAMRMLDCATTPWTANTSFIPDAVYKNGTTCYRVTAAYTSGASFGGADTSNTEVITGAPVTRNIYMKGNTSAPVQFNWANLSSGQKANFTAPHITYAAGPPESGLTQFCPSGPGCLPSAAQTNTTVANGGAAGEALVNFLRGERSNEGTFYRQRVHVLGDIVSSEARYVKTPLLRYGDAGYGDFKNLKSSRAGAVYVAANDGMLHAFDAATGQENWAYVPSMVLPEMYRLADKGYGTRHQYLVDGTPAVGDICPTAPGSACTAAQWRTILVGGLNRGGKGYYALDITDPTAPTVLWEFTDQNLGYSYGNPVITKLKTGAWVVMFASGYNNIDGNAPGVGRLYILNASTGALVRSIATSAGTAGSPNGLAKIAGYGASPATDNTVLAVYGGDVLGNLWRFDVNGDLGAAGYDAQLLATFRDGNGTAQSVTAEPTLIQNGTNVIVFAGTGRFLGTSDVSDTSTQSFYAVKDPLDTTSYGNIRAGGSGFVRQTLSSGTCPSGSTFCSAGQTIRTSTSNPVDWTTQNGWYIDFLTGGERATTHPSLQLGTLLFTTITPQVGSASACGVPTGSTASFIYALDYTTGAAVQGSGGVVAVSLGSALATAPVFIALQDGSVRAIVRVSDGTGTGTDLGSSVIIRPPVRTTGVGGVRRITWRELTTQ